MFHVLILIWEILVSNLGLETGCLGRDFCDFL